MVKVKESPFESTELLHDEAKNLVLFNDEFNTFDFVIDTLIEVCGHTMEQAETCTWIVHYKGKCAVKSGSFYELRPVYQEFVNRNLTASIE
ncbi:MAG: ATP-dependent Clp protease adaptor protein ClpS [Bacteroidetes bacterium]|jgi:ATP-dependent Clp protease adaptor protein ClpS|nr:MAG: ATP-dependent Clp protease adaptor protein ClpS [Bacteroidota bacterium]